MSKLKDLLMYSERVVVPNEEAQSVNLTFAEKKALFFVKKKPVLCFEEETILSLEPSGQIRLRKKLVRKINRLVLS